MKERGILQVVGYHNSGKTSWIEEVTRRFTELTAYRVFTVKHTKEKVNMDTPGTDTWRHRAAGAFGTLLQSPGRLDLQLEAQNEPDLPNLIEGIRNWVKPDLILVEGCKNEHYPKLVMIRGREDIASLTRLTHICRLLFHREQDLQWYLEQKEPSLQSCNYPAEVLSAKGADDAYWKEWMEWTVRHFMDADGETIGTE